jgi:DnaJ-domain-containing protein 1
LSLLRRLSRLARANVNSFVSRLRASSAADQQPPEADTPPQQPGSPGPNSSARAAPAPKDPRLARYYGQLELPYGADLAQVKRAYRRLVSRYHPDRHSHDLEKQRIATEVTQALSHAYHQLEAALKRQDTSADPDSGTPRPENGSSGREDSPPRGG